MDISLKLGVVKILLILLLILHTYTIWFDYRSEFHIRAPPPRMITTRPPLSSQSKVRTNGSSVQMANLHVNEDHPIVFGNRDWPEFVDTGDDNVPIIHTGQGKSGVDDHVWYNYPLNEEPGHQSSIQFISMSMAVIFLITAMICVVAVCGESYTLTYAMALLWTILFLFDLGAHLAVEGLSDISHGWHFLAGLAVSVTLWIALGMIEDDDIKYAGHVLL